MNLYGRMKAIVEYIDSDKSVIDVGTDHAYIPIYLALNNRNTNITATDINYMPLKIAAKNIAKHGLLNKINLIYTNGLNNINKDICEEIIIAGMGGELIADIINKCSWINSNKHHLILQPMSKPEYLRNFLVYHNFQLLSETPVIDNNKIYTVISCKFNPENKLKINNKLYYVIGEIPQHNNSQTKFIYLNYQYNRLSKILSNLNNIKNHSISSLTYLNNIKNLVLELENIL